MEQLCFYIHCKDNDFGIEINNDCQEAFLLYTELLSIFEKREDWTWHTNLLILIIKMSGSIREYCNNLVSKYKDKNPKIHKLEQNFKKIKDDEYFVITFIRDISAVQLLFINTLIKIYNQTENEQERANLLSSCIKTNDELFSDLFFKYKPLAFDSSIRKFIGEHNKQNRICRFCGNGINTKHKVTFKKDAHIIPEALGNKGLFSNEECDECNKKFGNFVEKDLIAFFDIHRAFFGVQGKNNDTPILKYDNQKTIIKNINKEKLSEIDKDNLVKTNRLVVVCSNNIKFNEESKSLNMILKSSDDITQVNIYKAFCKMAIELVDATELQYLQKTINWINEVKEKDYTLPKIAELIDYKQFVDIPFLALYIRKDDDYTVPHIVGEFKFKCFIYVFIIPYSKKDKNDFAKQDNYDNFFKFFKHYSFARWSFRDFSSSKRKKYEFNINFEQAK